MMRTGKYLLITLISILSSCSQALSTTGVIEPTSQGISQTFSQISKPVNTSSPTLLNSPTITVTPTITPTIGPPPDLELKNISIYPNTYEKWGQIYYLLGRARNNTNGIMVFHGVKPVVKFNFEIWDYDPERLKEDNKPYRHVKYIDEAEFYNRNSRFIFNCVLYPGEEGIFDFSTDSIRGVDGYLSREVKEEYSGPLGIWYTYESFYDTKSDLPSNLHPKAQNIKFVRDQAALKFEYDIIDIPPIGGDVQYAELRTWIILYDSNGKIINYLFKILNEYHGMKWEKQVHIRGNSGDTAYEYNFYKSLEMTQEMIDSVDHIEVINEFTPNHMC